MQAGKRVARAEAPVPVRVAKGLWMSGGVHARETEASRGGIMPNEMSELSLVVQRALASLVHSSFTGIRHAEIKRWPILAFAFFNPQNSRFASIA
jgi:hypothetical protein